MTTQSIVAHIKSLANAKKGWPFPTGPKPTVESKAAWPFPKTGDPGLKNGAGILIATKPEQAPPSVLKDSTDGTHLARFNYAKKLADEINAHYAQVADGFSSDTNTSKSASSNVVVSISTPTGSKSWIEDLYKTESVKGGPLYPYDFGGSPTVLPKYVGPITGDIAEFASYPLETDPSGKAMNEHGAKADNGKQRAWLCLKDFSRALEQVAEVTTVGANKYSAGGWLGVENGQERYMDAFARHMLAYAQGERIDGGPKGTGCLHLSQMIWNLLAVLELQERDGTSGRN